MACASEFLGCVLNGLQSEAQAFQAPHSLQMQSGQNNAVFEAHDPYKTLTHATLEVKVFTKLSVDKNEEICLQHQCL